MRHAAPIRVGVATAIVCISRETTRSGKSRPAWAIRPRLAARDVCYRVSVRSSAAAADRDALLLETDAVAEVHNTLRAGVPVVLDRS